MSEQDFKALFFKAAALLRGREFSVRYLQSYIRTECLTCGASIVGRIPPVHREGCELAALLLQANLAKEEDILNEIAASAST